MTTPAPSEVDADVASDVASVKQQRLQACEAAWLATLTVHGIACDDAQRLRMAAALPHLERIKQRLRVWRSLDDSFDARFDQEKHGAL